MQVAAEERIGAQSREDLLRARALEDSLAAGLAQAAARGRGG
jgi:hypothetical protein